MASFAIASSSTLTTTTPAFLVSAPSSSRLLSRTPTLSLRSASSPLRLSLVASVPLRKLMARASLGLTHPANTQSPKVSFAAKDGDVAEWKGDLLAIGVTEKDVARDGESRFQNPILIALDSKLGGLLAEASSEEDFNGKFGQSTVLRIAAGVGFKRVALLGLGGVSASAPAAFKSLGEAVAAAAKSAQAADVAVVLASPQGLSAQSNLDAAFAIASGI